MSLPFFVVHGALVGKALIVVAGLVSIGLVRFDGTRSTSATIKRCAITAS